MKIAIFAAALALVFIGAGLVHGVDKIEKPPDSISLNADNPAVSGETASAVEKTEPVYPMSPERKELLSSYSLYKNIWRFIGFAFDVIVFLAILYFGLSGRMRLWAEAISRKKILVYLFYVLLFMIVMYIIYFPISYYTEFVVEHDYGFSNQTFSEWFADGLKTQAVAFILIFIVVSVLYWLINKTRRWWLYFSLLAVPFAVLMIVIVPVVVAPVFNKFEPLQDKNLETDMIQLAHRAGIENPDVYQVDASRQSTKLNAYFTGMFATERIVLYDNIINAFTTDELKYVMGHEIGHYKMYHIWKGLFIAIVIIFAATWLANRLLPGIIRRNSRRFRFDRLGSVSSLPLLILFITIFGFLLQPVTNGISRYQEYRADEYGFKLSGVTIDDTRITYEKLSAYNLSDLEPPAFIEFWFYDHPALSKRIENINKYSEQLRSGV
ncbi:MAG: M48 family metallopeptidase [Candidatus Zixiibacteriota bacterium]